MYQATPKQHLKSAQFIMKELKATLQAEGDLKKKKYCL